MCPVKWFTVGVGGTDFGIRIGRLWNRFMIVDTSRIWSDPDSVVFSDLDTSDLFETRQS